MELICTDRNGFRRVNNREVDALKYTFGVEVGNFLIENIKIEYNPTLVTIGEKGKAGRVVNDKEIQMRSDYNPENLKWLGIFIHEAAHIWQRETERHRGGRGGENYRYYHPQLPTLKLEREEHAEAVRDWFYVNYGITSGLIGRANQIDREWVWRRILKAFGFDWDDSADVRLGLDELQRLVKRWTPVIEEIRNPNYLP